LKLIYVFAQGRAGQEVAIPQKRTTENAVVHNSKVKKELVVKKPSSSNGENGGASPAAAKSAKAKVPQQAAKQNGTSAASNPKSEKSKSSGPATAASSSNKKATASSSAPAGKKANGIRPASIPPAPESSSKAHPNNNNLSSAAAVKPKRVKRRKPGSRTDSEIIRYQKSNKLLIQKAPFRRHVKALVAKFNTIAGLRYQGGSMHALQEATEHYLTDLLRDSLHGTVAFKRVTMDAADIKFVRRIRKEIPMQDPVPVVVGDVAMDVDVQ
jgi:histone H3/H4